MKVKFIEHDKESIRFIGDILKIYLPKKYFEGNVSEYNGNEINTVGFFFFEVKSFTDEEKGEDGRFYTLKLPAKMVFEFDSKETMTKNIKDTGDIQYEVFTLNKGSLFCKNINVVQSAANARDFINMLHSGRFPSIIPYDEIIGIYLENLNINKLSLGCQSIIYELMISELMRWKKDNKIPFRKAINKSDVSPFDYTNINMKNIAFNNSSFNAIAFENIDKALITSIAREGKENVSPVEKTIKY